MTVRLGLVGPGAWGKKVLAAISRMPDAGVSSVCRCDSDVRPEGLPEGAFVTSNLYECAGSCDAVVVCTPPETHAEIVEAVLGLGRPVFVEKPAAVSRDEVARMFDVAASAGLPLLVDHVHLFSPAFTVLREWVKDWDPKSVVSSGGGPGPFRGHSALLDWGPHDLSMCLAVMRRAPDDVEVAVRRSGPGEIYDIHLGFGSSFAHLTVGNGMADKVRSFEVSSGTQSAVYDDRAASKLVFGGRPVPVHSSAPLDEALASFVSVVKGAKPDWRYEPWLSLAVASVLDRAPSVR